MRKVGASTRNTRRQEIIDRMPDWMRPSGVFGIGLQSAFLIAEEINFETKSLLTGESFSIRMTSPTGPERGSIFIRRLDLPPGRECGTKLELRRTDDAIPNRLYFLSNHSFTESILSDFDPISMTEIPSNAALLADEITKFKALALLPIKILFDGKHLEEPSLLEENQPQQSYYHQDTGIKIFQPAFRLQSHYYHTIAYRGQPIERYSTHLPFVHFVADILSASASECLTINRNDIKDSAKKSIHDKLSNALANYLATHIDQPSTPEEQSCASAFLLLIKKTSLRSDLENKWQELAEPHCGKTISELCCRKDFNIGWKHPSTLHNESDISSIIDFEIDRDSWSSKWVTLLFHYWQRILNRFVQIQHNDSFPHVGIIRFSSEPVSPYSDEALRNVLLKKFRNKWEGVGGRPCMPVWQPYERLASHVNKLAWCRPLSEFHRSNPHFVLPFFFPPTPAA